MPRIIVTEKVSLDGVMQAPGRPVDAYVLLVHPVVLGGGRRLFDPGDEPGELRLTDSVTTTTGVVIARYEPA